MEKAREVVEGAPDKTATHWVFRKIPNYYSVDFQSWFHDGEWWDSDCHTEQDLIDSYGEDFVVSLFDLKRLIDSLETIESWGGIKNCKELVRRATSNQEPPEKSFARKLQMDVANHESIYGGGDE
ncbi:hypothetical protein WDN63_020170 [Acinetobacter baumannii]|nr:hypothetical protein [Acinetobacter baumannii]